MPGATNGLGAAYWEASPEAGPTLFQVPLIMRDADRWLVHINKRPFDPKTGFPASVSNGAHWASLDQAVAALHRGKFDGLGFALGPDGTGNYWQGIDLDHIEANGLQKMASKLPGYVEYSPSGQGVHAIGYGAPFAAFKRGGVEAYCEKRFFTVTGNFIRSSL